MTGHGSSVLLIGVASPFQQATAELLEAAHYVVCTAPTGEAGLRLARQCCPDIVLLNSALPDVSSAEVCRRIRADPELSTAAIVLLSYPGGDQFPSPAIPVAEADGYISHPISEPEFLSHLEALVRLRQTAEALRLDQSRLESLYQLSQMVNEPERTIMDFALEAGVAMTRSKVGYIYFMSEDETTLTLHAWSREALRICAVPTRPTVYKVSETGLWGEAARQRRPIITNDYDAPNPWKKGYPQGHVPIHRHMNVPILENGKVVLIAGVGNKEAEYDDVDVQQLTLIMDAMWRIVQRKRANERLRESERRFRDMLETVRLVAVMLDSRGQIIFCNDFLLDLTGWQREEVMGRNWFALFVPPGLGIEQVFAEAIERSTIPPHYENEVVTRQGERRLIAWSNTMLRDSQGVVVGTASIGEDITERRRSEEKAVHSQRLLLALSQAAQSVQRARAPEEVYRTVGAEIARLGYQAVVLVLTDDGRHLSVSHLSLDPDRLRQIEEQTGLAIHGLRLPLLPGGFHEHILESREAACYDPAWDALKEIMPVGQHGLVGQIASAIGHGCGIAAPLIVGGEPYGLLVVAGVDLSPDDVPAVDAFARQSAIAIENTQLYTSLRGQMEELKRTQAQLIQSAKMAAVGELAAGVAHELNNPLTSVLGYVELMLQEALPAAVAEDLQTVVAEAQRARGIVRNLLNFARQTPPQRQPVDINELLRQTLGVIRYQIEKSRVAIQEDYVPDIGMLTVDAGQVKQVFLNLINNAVQSMPHGGTLSIRTARGASQQVAVSISDSGAGIPAEVRERIFEPFFTTKSGGTGLGLAISRSIVEAHGGRIELESEAGHGSSFTVWLPLASGEGA